ARAAERASTRRCPQRHVALLEGALVLIIAPAHTIISTHSNWPSSRTASVHCCLLSGLPDIEDLRQRHRLGLVLLLGLGLGDGPVGQLLALLLGRRCCCGRLGRSRPPVLLKLTGQDTQPRV